VKQKREKQDRLPEPPGWQDDDLSKFFQASDNNNLRIFHNYRQEWQLFADIDKTFDKLVGNLDWTHHEQSMFLAQRAHSSYLGALRLLLATQYVDASTLLRGALEYSVYALYFKDHPEALERWLKRHESEEARKAARKLRFSTMLEHLGEQDDRLGSSAQRLYDLTIDMGAHPNPAAVASAYSQKPYGEGLWVTHQVNYLAGEGPGLVVAAKTAVDVETLCIEVLCCTFPTYAQDLGITQEVEDLNRRT
jgi:hypothetical protein